MSDLSATLMPSAPHPPQHDALRPNVAIGQPDGPILLYTGPIDFSQSGRTFRADARIALNWLPSPTVRFEVPKVPSNVHPVLDDISLRLDDGTKVSRGSVRGIHSSMSQEGYPSSLSGRICERIIRPADGPVSYVLFLLPNFEQPIGQGVRYPDGSDRACRLTLRGGGWVITLDAVDDQKAVMKSLKDSSGFGVTQVGRLEKEDKSSFSAEDTRTALKALGWYVSFAAGQWTAPCLPTGFSADGKQVWEAWDYDRTVPFRNCRSWLDSNNDGQFEEPFPGFINRWLDDTWEEVIRVAIHWYIEANAQAGSIEGSIVLTQTAFELLASAVLPDENEKRSAADRIRLLFQWAGIPTEIPSELGYLVKLAKAYEEFMVNKQPDSTAAMAKIRNTITHPTQKNRKKFGRHLHESLWDAWTLGLRNLELCLLRLLNHQGKYADRIRRKNIGEVEPVPWAVVIPS